jgi:spore coat protein U-like protein
LLGLALLLLISRPAQAQLGNCSISTTPVAFGVYDVYSPSALDSTGNVHITCTGSLRAVSVFLSKGNGPNTMHRQMVYWHPTLGQSTLDYNLYLDPLREQVWGDPYPNSYNTGAKLFFWEATLDIYGRIPAEQDVPAGTYTDTITASINF